MRVLIVDDSVVFRSQIKAALTGVGNIEVAGTANNGKMALKRLEQGSVDLITLDMEMPEMGGIETLKEIRSRKFNVRVIMFSSHTTSGSEATLDALGAGADDFVAKPVGTEATYEGAAERIRSELLPKIFQFQTSIDARLPKKPVDALPEVKKVQFSTVRRELSVFIPSAIVIGSSTGGPPALEKVLKGLKSPIRIPIFIAQHMPPVFTASLAKRLSETCGLQVAEGKQGEVVAAHRVYVAPGDFHMTVIKKGNDMVINLDQSPQRNSVRPAVDNLFESAVAAYGSRIMGVVLTGMGEDGLQGSKAIKNIGGGVMIQSEASCVVFGMPGAIFNAGIHDGIGNLEEINKLLIKMTQ